MIIKCTKKEKITKEILLSKKSTTVEEWDKLIKIISDYTGILNKWTLTISIINNQIRYYVTTNHNLPITLNNLNAFMLKISDDITIENSLFSLPYLIPIDSSIIDIYNYCEIKKIGTLKYIKIEFIKITKEYTKYKAHIYTEVNNKLIKSRLILNLPTTILSIDYEKNKRFTKNSIPKFLDVNKYLPLLNKTMENNLFEVDTFPYFDFPKYLSEKDYDIARHSLIIGSSGTGKSKFISLLINNLKENLQYKIVMIDPHANIEKDIGGLGQVIDFKNLENSINLFSSTTNNHISSTELSLELFKSLISDQYNSKLERVLRHSIYLLSYANSFTFYNLKKLLLDIDYRNDLINEYKNKIPLSIVEFFFNDFNDLKTKSYGEAISPIISLIDELNLLPVFNEDNIENNLLDSIKNNYLTLISLNRTQLGDKITKTISGLVMKQLLTIIQTNQIKEHIIFIIDEVPTIENPILCRFLSESRKYNLSLILASQYFNQISINLQDAIFANVINYYLFRLSRLDAIRFADNIDLKIPLEDTKENKIKLLSTLNNRELIIRPSINNKLFPSIKVKTLNYLSHPVFTEKLNLSQRKITNKENKPTYININKDISLDNLLKNNSSNRKETKYE